MLALGCETLRNLDDINRPISIYVALMGQVRTAELPRALPARRCMALRTPSSSLRLPFEGAADACAHSHEIDHP